MCFDNRWIVLRLFETKQAEPGKSHSTHILLACNKHESGKKWVGSKIRLRHPVTLSPDKTLRPTKCLHIEKFPNIYTYLQHIFKYLLTRINFLLFILVLRPWSQSANMAEKEAEWWSEASALLGISSSRAIIGPKGPLQKGKRFLFSQGQTYCINIFTALRGDWTCVCGVQTEPFICKQHQGWTNTAWMSYLPASSSPKYHKQPDTWDFNVWVAMQIIFWVFMVWMFEVITTAHFTVP